MYSSEYKHLAYLADLYDALNLVGVFPRITPPDTPATDEDAAFRRFRLASTYTQNILLPVFTIVGFLGSVMVLLLVGSESQIRRLPSSRYLVILAFCSMLFTLSMGCQWIQMAFTLPTYNLNDASCKALQYITYTSDFCAAWIIVAMAFERFWLLVCPKRRRWFCSLKAALIIGIVVACVSVVYNIWVLLALSLDELEICNVSKYWSDFAHIVDWIEITFVWGLPSLLVITFNCIVLVMYRSHMRKQCRDTNVNGTIRTETCDDETALTSQRPLDAESSKVAPAPVPNERTSKSKELTRNLLGVTSAFILLNFPSYLCRLLSGEGLLPRDDTNAYLYFKYFELVAYMLYYAHHSIIFYLYAFNSRAMKKRLGPMFCSLVACDCCGAGHAWDSQN